MSAVGLHEVMGGPRGRSHVVRGSAVVVHIERGGPAQASMVCPIGAFQACNEVVGPRDRGTASAATAPLVPAIRAGVLTAVDAEVEGGMERVELRGGQLLLLGAEGVTDRIAQRVLTRQVVLEAGDEPTRLAERAEALGRLEFISGAAAFAE